MGGFQLVIGENIKGQLKAAGKFVLPLFGQSAGANYEAALYISTGDQFLDQESRHNGLPSPGVVGKQEAKREPRQH